MARKRKSGGFNPLSMAFLDVMSCGFGAVVLLFLILDHTVTESNEEADPATTAEVSLLQEEITDGRENLVQLRNTLDNVSMEVVQAEGLADQIQQEIDDFMAQLAALEGDSMATEESVEALRADVQALQEEMLRLQSTAIEEQGNSNREFLGDGDRQYLSGMYLGGNRILILLDMSASMLDESLVNVIRTRNMDEDTRRNAEKWQRATRIVDWITSQLPLVSQYQILGFNETVRAPLGGTENQWLEVADEDQINLVADAVGDWVPEGGHNLQGAIQAIRSLQPLPDNIYLVTDSLPTRGNGEPRSPTVTARQRLELYWDAIENLPANIPVNTILLPMEGDPAAAAAYWQLGLITGGSFITPSRDWP